MKKKPILYGIAGAVIGYLLLLIATILIGNSVEIIVRSPIEIRRKVITPVVRQELERKLLETEIRKQIEEEMKKQEKNTSLALPEPARAEFKWDVGGNISLIKKWASFYKVDEDLVGCIVQEESRGNPLAVGDSGKAVGVAQFHLPTWKMFREKMGLSTIDQRNNANEAIRTLTWALSNGYGYHWTPYKDGRCR